MDTNEVSKLVEFAAQLYQKGEGKAKPLDIVEKSILRQALEGNNLKDIQYGTYKPGSIANKAANLWKKLSSVTGTDINIRNVREELEEFQKQIQKQRSQPPTIPPPHSPSHIHPELNGHTNLNGKNHQTLSNGQTPSKEPEFIESHDLIASEIGINNGNNRNGNHSHNLNSANSNQADDLKRQLYQFSETNNSENQTIEDSAPDSTAEESSPSSQSFPLENYAPPPINSAQKWHNFINFIKPGVPLLVSVGILGSLFSLSWLASWYGVTHHLKGQLPQAKVGYRVALKLNPLSPSAHYNQGLMYEDQRDFARAYQEYEIARDGGLVAAYNNLARLDIIWKKDYTAALDRLQKALPLTEEQTLKYDIHKNMGWALLKLYRHAEAKAHLQDAIKLAPEHAPAHCILAQVLEHQQDNKGALVEWKQCLAYASNYKPDETIWIGMAKQRVHSLEDQ